MKRIRTILIAVLAIVVVYACHSSRQSGLFRVAAPTTREREDLERQIEDGTVDSDAIAERTLLDVKRK